jgi:serine protease
MKRLLSSVLLTGCLLTIEGISLLPLHLQTSANAQTIAQTQNNPDLFYTFYGRQIPLALRQNVVAVEFRQLPGTRGRGMVPLHVRLQQDLSGQTSGTRSSTRGTAQEANPEVEVKPLGDRFALVTVPTNTRNAANLEQRIRQQSYVEETLPVLAVNDGAEEEARPAFVLPNEIIVSFEENLSNSDILFFLNRHNLEMIRPLQFTQNRYLVRSRTERGTGVLNVANRLNGVTGIQSATPNFVQSLAYRVQEQEIAARASAPIPNASDRLQQILASLPTLETRYKSNLMSLSWHLNSTPQRGRLQPRTDVRATEAWENSNGGKDVVVAVIDSLLQWDHPDLQQNLYDVKDSSTNLLPGETHGWDFTGNQTVCSNEQPKVCVNGDPDTRISDSELAQLRPHFQNTFKLSDAELIRQYAGLTDRIRTRYPNISTREVANIIRDVIQSSISSEFHGTWSAGVVAAKPTDGQGAIGVAPNAKILPVRVFGLYGEITAARLIEAIGYAAERGADVINLSLGGMVPDQELTDQIFQVLDAHPDLAIVASAGNDSLDGVAFPAAIPGVISVGATNLNGKRTFYSSYGGRLDVVAPGGDTSITQSGGILTTGGTWVDGFWHGMTPPNSTWASNLDPMGKYVQVQGTSFSAPTVSGVVALMKGVNPGLKRDRISRILKETASYQPLTLSRTEQNRYRLQSQVGLTLMEDRLSGVFPLPRPVSAEQYFFGYGLVNAEAAVKKAKE